LLLRISSHSLYQWSERAITPALRTAPVDDRTFAPARSNVLLPVVT
jgi:hypothetical protein